MIKYIPGGVNAKSESAPSRAGRASNGSWSWGQVARRLSQFGVLAAVLPAPLLIGGAPPAVQVILSFIALMASGALVLSRRGELRSVSFLPMAAVAVGGTLFQLIPLPSEVAAALSPAALEIRSDSLGRRPALLPLTLDVPGTVMAALRGFTCLAILVVTAKAMRWRGRTTMFALPLALLGGLIGLLSFAQRGLGAESILGLYTIKDMPGSGFFGTFVNGNHAGSFFTLSALIALGCFLEADGRWKVATGLSTAISIIAVFSTGSRMGLVGLGAGLFGMGTCWLVNRLGRKRGLLLAGALAAVLGPATALLALSQRRPLQDTTVGLMLADQKLRGWQTAMHLTGSYPFTGVGRGAFEGPAAAFRTDAEGVRLVFPENLIAQMTTEWGIPLTLIIGVLFMIPAVQVVQRLPRWEPLFQGAACGVFGVLVHELADFGLELPGVAFPVAMAVGLCAGRLQMSDRAAEPGGDGRFPIPVLAGTLGVWAVVLGFGIWAAPRTSESEGQLARELSGRNTPQAAGQLKDMTLRHPAEYYFALQAARQAMISGSTDALRQINRALRLFPQAHTPHLMAFHYLAGIGRRSQAAVEYRLAVERGHQFSYEEVARKVGPSNVMRAVRQQPQDLLDLANAFVQAGRNRDAEACSTRAVDLAEGAEPARMRRMEIALRSQEPGFISKAAVELARIASTPAGQELAGEGLAASGDLAGAQNVLRQALTSSTGEDGVAVRAARVLFKHGDAEGAGKLLAERSSKNLPLADRIAAEQLLAEIADKLKQPDAAAAARTRARLLGRLKDGSAPPP
jgi:tetratricopeptide (TPR) repeat protein